MSIFSRARHHEPVSTPRARALVLAAFLAGGTALTQPTDPAATAPGGPEPQSDTTAEPPTTENKAASQDASIELSPPTTVEEELDRVPPGVVLKRELDRLAAQTNLRIGVANTLLLQQASGGPGDRTAAGGDLDLLAKWTLIGPGTKNAGMLAFAGEYRYQIGDQPPSALGPEIGTLIPTTNGFGERPMTVKELYWDQRLLDGALRLVAGRVDPENLFGGHRLQSANFYFLNKAFSSNPTVAFPGPGAAAAIQIKPTPWLFIDGGVTDANGRATTSNFEGFFSDGEFLTFAEVGVTPTIEGLGEGRYRLAAWHINAREDAGAPHDQGFTISCDQDLSESFLVFLRYGHADGDVTRVTDSVQGGVGIKDVLGEQSLTGIAAAWSAPERNGRRDEKVLECFHRFQITETTQLTLGAQAIIDPSQAPDDELLGVFSIRLRIAF